MPTVVRWYVKTAMLYLAASLALGVWIATGRGGQWGPTYLHLFLVGWVTQLIFGVAIWMLPTLSKAHPRGYEGLNWAVYGLLNVGLVLRAVAEPLLAGGRTMVLGALLVLAALAQWLAGVLFVLNAWGRVRGPRQRDA